MTANPYRITINNNHKKLTSQDYNYIFNMQNGYFARWGRTKSDDPHLSPYGPELLDIEVSTICHRECPWCYKSNNPSGTNMDFKTFKMIIDKVPQVLTQVAFGIGDIDANPDLWKMFSYCRDNQVIPNITINGQRLDDLLAERLANQCGAVAVSHYNDDACFSAVDLLAEKGLTQVNIHQLMASETFESCLKLIESSRNDPRLRKINAIVFLALKPKGERNTFHPLPLGEFSELVHFALEHDVNIGFDSCSANNVLKVLRGHPNYSLFRMLAEPCESSCFSFYVNVEGIAYPCSFLEGEPGYESINILTADDFMKDVWYHPFIKNFRDKLLQEKRNCPHFAI